MKKCPYCAEEIQDEAVICRYCGRNLPSTIQANTIPGEVGVPVTNTGTLVTKNQLKCPNCGGMETVSRNSLKYYFKVRGGFGGFISILFPLILGSFLVCLLAGFLMGISSLAPIGILLIIVVFVNSIFGVIRIIRYLRPSRIQQLYLARICANCGIIY